MGIIMYSTGCPKCKVLEKKLNDKNIKFKIVSDTDSIISLGFTTVPVLEVDNITMDFKEAVDWVNKQ